jgi:hypothetical protein
MDCSPCSIGRGCHWLLACRELRRTACQCWFAIACLGICFQAASVLAADSAKPKKIALIAGTKSHGPGEHEYELGMRVIQHGLETSPNAPPVKCEVHLNGWRTDAAALDDADTIVLFCDGSDHTRSRIIRCCMGIGWRRWKNR